ncbi:hypothetical protein AN403_2066 [Pseudomonas fluorescens]|uniref:Uncharacterized protein n=1 Tax=Pseudomonas fluorescens TaxID=294 RepID=A0A0P9B2S9_PSEFL|nr:hypothetical protein [Pseudomonas fluorescens]KPU56819.1 hypothetical protein AN403_2066 [Pseudomonas fluorescens]
MLNTLVVANYRSINKLVIPHGIGRIERRVICREMEDVYFPLRAD